MSEIIIDKTGLTAEQWGKEHFEFEYCGTCGGDWDEHDYILILGGWFARCKAPDCVGMYTTPDDGLDCFDCKSSDNCKRVSGEFI